MIPIKKGLRYAIHGEFTPIVDYIKRPIIENIISESFKPYYSATSPPWLNIEEIQFVSSTNDDGRFFTSINDNTFQIETNKKFDQVNFKIIAAKFVKEIDIKYKYKSSDGNYINDKKYVNTGSRNEPSIPISIKFEDPTDEVSITINISEVRSKINNKMDAVIGKDRYQTHITKPTFTAKNSTPIFLISIDSLRYDSQTQLAPLLDEFDESAYIPQEPRTQGVWTPQSHASMFTGTHPGTHNFIGGTDKDISTINDSLITLGEIMSNEGYKSSALTTSSYLYPEFGFGDGFDRFYCTSDPVHYFSQKKGTRESTSKIITWLDEDYYNGYENIFYFWHIFPPHAPYIPPAVDQPSEIDLRERYRKDTKGKYMKNVKREPRSEDSKYSDIIDMYDSCTRFVANQVSRLINYLKNIKLYDDSLIIILGDHGEEFGERGFYGHNSLYDANIRPFMLVKPPVSASWGIRNKVDFIDILPTISNLIGADTPEQCDGVPLQTGEVQRPRITERIRPDYYNLSVELDGWKAIFTYEDSYPYRPDLQEIGQPVHEEYYSMESIRRGVYKNKPGEITNKLKKKLSKEANKFIKDTSRPDDINFLSMSKEKEDQLKDLDYL